MMNVIYVPDALWCLLKNIESSEPEMLVHFHGNNKAVVLLTDEDLADREAESNDGYTPYRFTNRSEATDFLLGAMNAGITHASIDPSKREQLVPIQELLRSIQNPI